jgi:hypothetical protein
VLAERAVHSDRRLGAGARGRWNRAARVEEELRPDQREALDELGVAHVAGASLRLDLVEPGDLPRREPAAQVRVLLREHARERSERVDRHHPEQPFGVRDEQMQREVPTPGVADRPAAVDTELVQHCEGVCHVGLDGERGASARRRRAPLRVAVGQEQAAELGGERVQVVGHRRASVEKERRRAGAATVAAKPAAWDRDLERLLAHRAPERTPEGGSGSSAPASIPRFEGDG